jgi:hypothetical protein
LPRSCERGDAEGKEGQHLQKAEGACRTEKYLIT